MTPNVNEDKKKLRQIAVLTVGRSDFGRYLPVLRALRDRKEVDLRLLVGGAHYSEKFGQTWREIEEAGFTFENGMEMFLDADTPDAVGKSIGLGTLALSQAFSCKCPDLLVLLGDRYEMLCGANAAIGFNLPVVHIHGGAVTEGAIDELVRHALTKMSHLHLVSIGEYAKRIHQMGEEEWRIHVVGAPGLDDLPNQANTKLADISESLSLDLSNGFVLATFHPVTLETKYVKQQTDNLLNSIEKLSLPSIITYPNSDRGHQEIISAIEGYADTHSNCRILANATSSFYASLMANASLMVGNSSSGIVEAATFRLPVVNIGTRQSGKLKPQNIIDCGYSTDSINDAINIALSPEFRDSLLRMVNPYGDGKSGSRIADILCTVPIDDTLLRKRFANL